MIPNMFSTNLYEQNMKEEKKISIPEIQTRKKAGKQITMLTAYDYPTAMLVDESGIDIILVGDSVAMTVLGHENTVSVTMDQMLHHCKAVARGRRRAFLVGDMPFLSYQVSVSEAIANAGRFIKEAGMDAVKVEGGTTIAETVRAVVDAGIPVMGHIGLTPQSATKLGGYRVQGKNAASAGVLLDDAKSLQEAGCFAVVVEAVTTQVTAEITKQLSIPTIGIGSGRQCDGQVLVFHDIMGLFEKFSPKFVKQFADIRTPILNALQQYKKEVENGMFPADEHSFMAVDEDLSRFLQSK
jgi:3-methyl-2-oxobutanoate hydroxymethyltransferase